MPLTQRKQTEIISIILDSDDELDENPASCERSTAQTQSSWTPKKRNEAERIEAVSTSSGTNPEDEIMLIEFDDVQSVRKTNKNASVQAVTSSTTTNRDDENEHNTSPASHNDNNDIVLIEIDCEETSNENVAKERASSSTQTREDVTSSHKKAQRSSPVIVDLIEIDRDKPGTSGLSSSVLNKETENVVLTQILQDIPVEVLDTQSHENNSNENGKDADIMIVEDDNDSIPKDSITSIIDQENNNINIQCKVRTCDRGTNTDTLERSGIFGNVKYDPEDDLIFMKPMVEEMRYKIVDGMHICLVCKRLFNNIALMLSHLKIHDEKSRLCYRCGLIFDTFPDTLKHMKVCIPEKNFTPLRRCSVCKFKATDHSTMRHHLYYVHGNKRLICNVCNISFYNPNHLRTHVQVEHRNYYKCNICNSEIMFPNFDWHMKIHLLNTINDNTPKCTFCNEHLPFSDIDVKRHFESHNHKIHETIWKTRNKISDFTCLCCYTPVKFNRFYEYSLHLKTHGYYKMNMDEVITACLSLQRTNRLPFSKQCFKNSSQTSSRQNRVISDGQLPLQVKNELLVAEDLTASCSSAKKIKTDDSVLSSEYEVKTEYSSSEDRSISISESQAFVGNIKTEYTDDKDDVFIVNNDNCSSNNIKTEIN